MGFTHVSSELEVLNTPEWTLRLSPKLNHELSKVRQLYLALYEVITQGELINGQLLPSSRQLSQQLQVGRNTVIAVYTQLQDEELIETQGRRGTRVTHSLPSSPKEQGAIAERGDACSLSDRSDALLGSSRSDATLAPGVPDSELFPIDAWRRAMSIAARLPAEHLGYSASALPQLQTAIARYLAIYRSLIIEPQQVVVTSSTRQSLALAAMLYANHNDHAWIESPGYPGAVDAFRMMGLTLSPLTIDSLGALPPKLTNTGGPALIYLTPCFQYPTGAALSPDRRRFMLDFAHKHKSVIFEDDYDSEFRDASQARPALASSSDAAGAVVLHAGTFSKLIFPAARIAWLVVPKSHVQRSQYCLKALGGGSNTIAQAAVAEVLNNGSLAKHLQRARGVYAQRRHALLAALEDIDMLHSPTDTGGSLSLVVRLKQSLPAKALAFQFEKHQLGVQFVEDLMWNKPVATRINALVLGLGNVSTLQVPQTVRALKSALCAARD